MKISFQNNCFVCLAKPKDKNGEYPIFKNHQKQKQEPRVNNLFMNINEANFP